MLIWVNRMARLLTRDTKRPDKENTSSGSIHFNPKLLKSMDEIFPQEDFLSRVYNKSPYDVSNKSDEELLKIASKISRSESEFKEPEAIESTPKYTKEETIARLQKAVDDGTLKIVSKCMLEERRNATDKYSEGINYELAKNEIKNILYNHKVGGVDNNYGLHTVKKTIGAGSSLEGLNADNIRDFLFADEALDGVAALHAFYTNRAESLYSGEELDNKKSEINKFFEEQTDDFSEKLSNTLSRFGDSDGIKQSVKDIIQDRSLEYQSMLKNGFKTGVEGTRDDWATDSGYFVASKLRQSISTSITDKAQSNSKYSASDIKSAAAMDLEYKLTLSMNKYKDADESMGLDLGMLAIKNELALSVSGISENGKSMLRNTFSQHVDKKIEEQISLEESRNQDKDFSKLHLPTNINKSNIKNIINDMVSSLKSNDFEKTLRGIIKQNQKSVEVKKEQQLETFGNLELRYKDFSSVRSDALSATFKCYNLFVGFIGAGSSISETPGVDIKV